MATTTQLLTEVMRLGPVTPIVDEATFVELVESREFAVVCVSHQRFSTEIAKKLAKLLGDKYSQRVAVGEILGLRSASWLAKRLRSEHGRPCGFYLLRRGKVLGSVQSRAPRPNDALGETVAMLAVSLCTGAEYRRVHEQDRQRQVEASAHALFAVFDPLLTSAWPRQQPDAEREGEVPATTPWDPPPHELLGVPPSATRSEIDRAHRQKIALCHPDKVEMLDPEIRQLAARKTTQLNVARDQLLAQLAKRGR